MPPVKKKKTTAKSNKRKNAAKKTQAAFTDNLLQRIGMAGGAGIALVALMTVVVLWASGVFGRVAEDASRSAGQQLARMMVSAGLDVRKITIIGRDQSSHYAIKNALGPITGTSMMHFDHESARARIEEIGWVRSAAVSRLWPNQINISIRERVPAALWQVSGALRLVDQDGAIIREIGAYEYTDLPLIVGAGAPEAAAGILNILDEVETFDGKIAALVRVSNRRWNLRLGNDMDVKLPETDYEKAVKDLAVLQEAVEVLDRNFEYIDLRDPERAFFRCNGTANSAPTLVSVLSQDFVCGSSN